MVVNAQEGKKIVLGRLGENDALVVRFFVRSILYEFPGATFTLLNQRANDAAAYPVNTVLNGNYLEWTVKSSDVAQKGNGECQIVAYKGEAIVKTVIYKTEVLDALDGSGTPPQPWQSWVDSVVEASEEAKGAAQEATAIVSEIHHLSAEAETLTPESQATASYINGVLTIGVPKGDKGDQGIQGEQGERGEKGDSVLKGTLVSGEDYILESEVSE